MSPLLMILLANFLVSLVSFSGGSYLLLKKILTEQSLKYFVSFAAGAMLSSAFLDLLPEALEGSQNNNIFISLLLGVVIFFFMERYLLWFHHHDSPHDIKPSAHLILIGDAFHNFFDGIAIAAAFLVNPSVGITTTLAITAHEIPQEIADLGVLIHGGMSHLKALLYNFLSALTAIFGGIIGYFFLTNIEGLLSPFIAFIAGMFIYIACSDLIPELHKNFRETRNIVQSMLFLIGILTMYVLSILLTH